MAELSVFFLGAGTGFFFAALTLMMTRVKDAKDYPLGGLLPAGLMVFNLGGSSPFGQAGILAIGGLLGYYLFLLFWEGRPEALKQTEMHSASHAAPEAAVVATPKPQVAGSSNLADYL